MLSTTAIMLYLGVNMLNSPYFESSLAQAHIEECSEFRETEGYMNYLQIAQDCGIEQEEIKGCYHNKGNVAYLNYSYYKRFCVIGL